MHSIRDARHMSEHFLALPLITTYFINTMQLCKTVFPVENYDQKYITKYSAGVLLLLLEMCLIEPTCDGWGVYVILAAF